jgi:hypothetical protein
MKLIEKGLVVLALLAGAGALTPITQKVKLEEGKTVIVQ